MLAGPGTCHRCDEEWSLKNLFPWGLHCQTDLRAAHRKKTGLLRITNATEHQIQRSVKKHTQTSTKCKQNYQYMLTCITNFWSIYFLAMFG